MIQAQLKLRLNKTQEAKLNDWLWILTGVWNWAIRKIELDARDKIYHNKREFQNLLANHCEKLDIPSHTLQGILSRAHLSWTHCYKKLTRRPHFKGQRNKLNSIPFPDTIRIPNDNHIGIPGLGTVRFHKQQIPNGKIKCGNIVKRTSGWYLCLFIDTDRKPIKRISNNKIGIDPGFKYLLTLSTGEKIPHPRELEHSAKRLAQAQRGHNKKLASRLQEHIANQRKDRNHKLSLKLVQENAEIYFSKDNINGIAKKFGKSVSSSSHYQLRQMLLYKSCSGGTKYVEVDSKFSTMTCSTCGAKSGPTGWDGLAVRQWRCGACGASHDRDVNAARNTLLAGVGTTHEMPAMAVRNLHKMCCDEVQLSMIGVPHAQ